MCLNDSLEKVFEMWTSITLDFIDLTASAIPTDVWVNAAALSIIPSEESPTSWIWLINSPSIFDW